MKFQTLNNRQHRTLIPKKQKQMNLTWRVSRLQGEEGEQAEPSSLRGLRRPRWLLEFGDERAAQGETPEGCRGSP